MASKQVELELQAPAHAFLLVLHTAADPAAPAAAAVPTVPPAHRLQGFEVQLEIPLGGARLAIMRHYQLGTAAGGQGGESGEDSLGAHRGKGM